MFKVFRAEIKKMISKPGIYVLAVLLAVILVLGVFIYKPTIVKDETLEFTNKSALENYNRFLSEDGNNGYKISADKSITITINKLNNYTIEGTNYNEYISSQINSFNIALANYRNYSNLPLEDRDEAIKQARRNAVVNTLNNLYSTINSGINLATFGSYPIITSKANYENLERLYKLSYDLLRQDTNEVGKVCEEFDKKYKNDLFQSIDNLTYPRLADNTFTTYTSTEKNTRYSKLLQRLDDTLADINALVEECKKDNNSLKAENISKMAELCTKYVNICNLYSSLVEYELVSNALGSVSVNNQIDLLHLNNRSEYDTNTNLIKYIYLFDNNKTNADYARPLTIGVTSNGDINAYDYSYFILRLFSFVIIAYAIMTACHSIAGEIKEGSMRYFAIRPVSRANIYFGKILAIFTMSTIITIFSTIIAFFVGWSIYGIGSLNILTIFNSANAIVIHPFVMVLLYVASMLFELLIYVSIAMLLSTLLKSDLLSVTLVLLLYLVNTLLPMFVGGINSALTYYPFSHISLYALFGSSIYAPANNFFNLLLGAKVYVGTNIIVTSCVILAIILIVNIASSQIFKKKEL